MKKRSRLLVIVMMAAFLLTSVSIVSASPDSSGTIDCVLDITYDEYAAGEFYWLGTVTGEDCDVEGAIRFDAVDDEYTYPGKTMHFVEEFTIWPDSGGWIKGKNWGVWNLTTFRYRANGWVRESSDEWQHLVGSKYHEGGVTGDLAEGLPLLAPDGWMKIVPANRQNTP